MKAKTNKIYIVYKTTNKINGKIYVGYHEQDGYEFDGYLGSGPKLKQAIEKYGKENFERETLYSYYSKEVALKREAYIVNESFIERRDTYNLKLGGSGTFHRTSEMYDKIKDTHKKTGHYKMSQCHTKEAKEKRELSMIKHYKSNPHFKMEHCRTPEAIKKSLETRKKNGTYIPSHLHKKEIYMKGIETRRKDGTLGQSLKNPLVRAKIIETNFKNGHYKMNHCRTEEAKDKRKEKIKLKALDKEPRLLNDKGILLNPEGLKVLEGNLYEISLFINGKNLAFTNKWNIFKRYDKGGPFKHGKWKGYSIQKLEN